MADGDVVSEGSALTHLDATGQAHMVDVSDKASSHRAAIAHAEVHANAETLDAIRKGLTKKGDVLAVARIAGIMAAKRTSELIPLCHPISLSSVSVDIEPDSDGIIHIMATARTTGQTGVEMEALTAASVAALTIYDMCKSIDRGMTIREVALVEKSGGKSGTWRRD